MVRINIYFKVIILVFASTMAFSNWNNPLFGQKQMEWDFERNNSLKDRIGGKSIDTGYFKCYPQIVSLNNRNYLKNSGKSCILPFNVLSKNKQEIIFSFDYKGGNFIYHSFPAQYFKFGFNYDVIFFNTSVNLNGKNITDEWTVKLDGIDIPSYGSIANDEWHQFVFSASLITGEKKIFIDGILYDKLIKKIPKNSNGFTVSENDGFTNCWSLDNFSVSYDEKKFIATHGIRGSVSVFKDSFDVYDFAPNHPVYNKSILSQIYEFPNPRFKINSKPLRNVSWFDITYLSRDYENVNYPIGTPNVQNAISLSKELYNFWNYYLEIPTLRIPKEDASKKYLDPKSVEGALVDLANKERYQTSTVIYQSQINPSHFNINSRTPLILSQDLPYNYYLKDSLQNPIIFKNKKWLSPLMSFDIVEKDGLTSGRYIYNVNKLLDQPISFISENGEVYGHKRPKELWKMDPLVSRFYDSMNLDNGDFNGWFQNLIDSTYKANVLKFSNSPNSYFTFYDLSASSSDYWSSYRLRKNLNSIFNGGLRSTPAFYPATPSNWIIGNGPYMGYGKVAEGRKAEIQLGVKRFAPFVSAGWSFEEDNIRPAQWLALLKAMVVLGADFFHTGYFNITQSNGRWTNGRGPFDPRGYLYQIVMPVYAQAFSSIIDSYITDGELLKGNLDGAYMDFRIKGLRGNELIIIRKLNNKYLIYGSIQNNSNKSKSILDSIITEIEFDGNRLKIPIRKQGNIYEFSNSSNPTFIQFDGWHEANHPYYWTKNILIESELGTFYNNAFLITESKDKYDFSIFRSFVRLKDYNSRLRINIPPVRLPNRYKLVLIAKSKSSSFLTIQVVNNRNGNILGNSKIKIDSPKWKEYEVFSDIKITSSRSFNDFIYDVILKNGKMIDIDCVKIIPY